MNRFKADHDTFAHELENLAARLRIVGERSELEAAEVIREWPHVNDRGANEGGEPK